MAHPYIAYKKGYKYQLVEPYEVTVPIRPDEDVTTDYVDLTRDGKLIIKKGYAWDGPSGPTIDTPSFMRGSLVHDALYQLLRMQKIGSNYRKEADEEIRRMCLEDGMWRLRAWYVYRALRKGGGFAADPANQKKAYYAPRR